MTKAKGFLDLPKGSKATKHSLQPKDAEPLKYGYGYFSYHKCEPDSAAARFAQIQINRKHPMWMGMSLKRFFAGISRFTKKMDQTFPSKVPKLTDAQMEGPDFEIIPPPPGREFLSAICGLRILEKEGVIKIRTIGGEHYLIPTEKFVNDLEKGIKWVVAREQKMSA
jgi:hypothetical protein